MDTDGSATEARELDEAVHDQEPEDEARELEFKGRKIAVRMPSSGQMAVLARLAATWDEGRQDPDQLLRLMNRTLGLLAGLMVNRGDADWLEDGLASRRLDFGDVTELFHRITDTLVPPQNRAERRARARRSRNRRGR